jgi:hypothetical protein
LNKIILVVIVIGAIASFGVMMGMIGQGQVRHAQIYLPERVLQTVAFQDIDGGVNLVGISGVSETENPTLVTRVTFEYVLTVINQGDKHHRLYIDGLNIQTDLLLPGEQDTITIKPMKKGTYNYYDKRERLELLGQIKVVAVTPDEKLLN